MTNSRRVIATITLTLDGHTTGPGGPYDMSCIAPHGMSDQARDGLLAMTSATTALLGRKNYEGFGGYWPTVARDAGADPRDRRFAQWLDQVDKVVFSTTMTDTHWENSTIAATGPVEYIRALRGSGQGDIRVLSSQSLIRQLLEAGELDRLEITLAPEVVSGGARPFSDDLAPSRWSLAEAIHTDTGAVRLAYDHRP